MAGPGPEQIGGSIAGHSFSLQTTNLMQILLLVAGAGGGFLLWQAMDRRLQTSGQVIIQHQESVRDELSKFAAMLASNRENTREETQRILKNLIILNHNLCRPTEEQIPLGLNGELPQ